jgi:CBS domain-containing protein
MFGIYGVGGPIFNGRLEELPAIRAVTRRAPVPPIGTAGNELGEIEALPQPPLDPAGAAAYRRMLHIDEERGPLVHARQIMSTGVITVLDRDDVVRAWRTLTGNRIHQAPVLNGRGGLVGIVSERDLLTSLNLDHDEVRDALTRRVADVMTSPVVAADPLTDIRRIARAMLERDVDGVPIVDAGQTLVGFISRSDVLRAVVTDPPLSLWR